MAIISAWVGRVFQDSARVIAKTDDTDVTLAISDEPTFADPVIVAGPVVPLSGANTAQLDITELEPGTQYYYMVTDGADDGPITGQFKTHPPVGQPASFSFATAGDAGLGPDYPDTTGEALIPDRISNAPTHDTIREHNPLFFAHLGDMHYYNPGGNQGSGNSVDDYRRAWDDVLLQSRQHRLYREVPLVYTWDDHDYGANNSYSINPGKFNAGQVYREKVPSYDLPDPQGAIYFHFQVGRALFIVLDTRFYKDLQTTPDGPTKTMIGQAQKDWLENLLETVPAEICFIISSVHWILGEPGDEGWGSYAFERDEIAEMLSGNGWSGRVAFISADAHTMCMDSGANNFWPANAPAYGFASIDAGPSSLTFPPWDIGISNAREQFGIINVTDHGEQIIVTVEGYQNDTVLFTHSWSVSAAPPEPPEPPEPEPPSSPLPIGTESPIVEWRSYDFITGELISELPEIRGGPIGRLIGNYNQATLRLPIPIDGPGSMGEIAFQATRPRMTMIVAVVNNEPAWGGRVTRRRGGTDGHLELSTVTTEAYFKRRRVQDHSFSQVDEAEIMRALIEDAGDREIEGLGLVGGINLEIDAPKVGQLADDEYVRTDRATVYDRLRERSARNNGLEWTIELMWTDSTQNHLKKVIRVAPRVGIPAVEPTAIFEVTADSIFESESENNARYNYDEDESESRAATWVETYAPGEGEDQLSSDPAIAEDLIQQGYPIEERHYQPSSSIINKNVLNSHATKDLVLRKNGAKLWQIEARWNVIPRLNIDWRMGDDIAWKLVGHRHPSGIAGQGRCIGWDMNPETGLVSPILLDPQSGG